LNGWLNIHAPAQPGTIPGKLDVLVVHELVERGALQSRRLLQRPPAGARECGR
jgi:hypothetical protein